MLFVDIFLMPLEHVHSVAWQKDWKFWLENGEGRDNKKHLVWNFFGVAQ